MDKSEFVKFCPVCNKTKQNVEWSDDVKFIEFSKGFHYIGGTRMNEQDACFFCEKGKLIDSPLTFEELELFDDVSDSDRSFLEAMIQLKKDDIIEYRFRINQFKIQEEQLNDENGNEVMCPTCRSTNVRRISTTTKVVNIAVFGLFGNRRKKTFHCYNCDYEW